jgi:hypothetical protein
MSWQYESSAEVDPVSGKIVVLAMDPAFYPALWIFDPDANALLAGPIYFHDANGRVASPWGYGTHLPDIHYDPMTDSFLVIDG